MEEFSYPSLTFVPRPLEDYLEAFFTALALNNSRLTDRSPGSALYTLGRAFAAVCAEQDLRLRGVADSVLLATARGEDLDALARDLGLRRRGATAAVGTVLAIADAVTQLAPDTLMVDTNSGVQLVSRNRSPVTVGFVVETRIPVEAVTPGAAGNLPAGTLLVVPSQPQIRVTVGSSRQQGGVVGDLRGGADRESDSDFRARLQMAFRSRRGGTWESIRAAILAHPGVEYVEPQVVSPGVVLVWIDSASQLSESSLRSIRQTLEQLRPVGVETTPVQLRRRYISINVQVLPRLGVDLDQLRAETLEAIRRFLLNLGRGRGLEPERLRQVLLAQLPLRDLEVLTPQGFVECGPQEVLRSDDVRLTVP